MAGGWGLKAMNTASRIACNGRNGLKKKKKYPEYPDPELEHSLQAARSLQLSALRNIKSS